MDTFIKDAAELRPFLAAAFDEVGEWQYAKAVREGKREDIILAGILAMIKAYTKGREDMRRELASEGK